MQPIPFIGRLQIIQYFTLVISIILILLESLISIITLALPRPIINLCYKGSRRLFNSLSSQQGRRSRSKKRNISSPIANAHDFVELCEIFGYYAEEHIVQTGDGYLLGVHRLGWRKGEENSRVNSGPDSIKKKVVYLHHGLLMNSDVWVCLTEKERCLPFILVEQGYDVWLGNNRGNKYSKKNIHLTPTDVKFWNFSMDQFAFHDIPDTINYILETTSQRSLSYIGFSQGTAQAFATLSIHPTLNDKVDVFIALAPAMSPKGMSSALVDTFVKASPDVLFLAFGRRAILASATMWQAILYPPIFIRLIDMSLTFFFNWRGNNITPHQKLAAYPHLYSFTSTKSVVHWFQIMRNAKFQMFDDEVQGPLSVGSSRYYKVAKFPTRNIKTPIVLVYGGSDSLVDIKVMLKELPNHTIAKEIPHYEHLDFLWASDVDTRVFPHVLDALETYTDPEKRRLDPHAQFRPAQRPSYIYRGNTYTTDSDLDDIDSPLSPRKTSDLITNTYDIPSASNRTLAPSALPNIDPHTPEAQTTSIRDRDPRVRYASLSTTLTGTDPSSARTGPSLSSSSRPEGWWSSSDEVDRERPGTGDTATTNTTTADDSSSLRPSPSSGDLHGSLKKRAFGLKGINVGAAKAVGGVEKGEVSPGVHVPVEVHAEKGLKVGKRERERGTPEGSRERTVGNTGKRRSVASAEVKSGKERRVGGSGSRSRDRELAKKAMVDEGMPSYIPFS